MATTIQLKRSTLVATKPTSLESGELAISLQGGTLWYGDHNGQVRQHTQPVYVGPASDAIIDPREGMIRFDPSSQNMSVYSSGKWVLVGFPQAGGTINSHLTIQVDGTVYLQTSYSESSGVPQLHLTDTLVKGGLTVEGNLWLTPSGQINAEHIRSTDDIVADDRVTANSFKQTTGGVCVHWDDSNLVSGRMYVMTEASAYSASASNYNNGDIIFGYS